MEDMTDLKGVFGVLEENKLRLPCQRGLLKPARLFPELFPGARRLVGVQVQRSISGVRKNKFPGKHKKTVAELGVTNPTPRCRHARPPTFQTVTSSYAGKAITQVPEKGSF